MGDIWGLSFVHQGSSWFTGPIQFMDVCIPCYFSGPNPWDERDFTIAHNMLHQ